MAFFQILNFINMPKFGKLLPLEQFSKFWLYFNTCIQVLPCSPLKFKSFRLITSVKILHSTMLPTALFYPKQFLTHIAFWIDVSNAYTCTLIKCMVRTCKFAYYLMSWCCLTIKLHYHQWPLSANSSITLSLVCSCSENLKILGS